MEPALNYDLLEATEDIPEAGLKCGDRVFYKAGRLPLHIRDWPGNPGLLFNLACEDRLRFVPEGEGPAPGLRLLP